MDINKIFEKWIQLTEVNPNEKKFVITNKNVDILEYNSRIKSAIENGSDLDAAIVLKNCFKSYVENTYYSVFDICFETQEYKEKTKLANEIITMLMDEEIEEYERELEEQTTSIAEYYGIKENISELSKQDITEIYMNAKKAVNNLDALQFKEGNRSSNKPKYIKQIRMFNDLNQLLAAVASMDIFDGITLNCIIDKDNAAYSWFCFIIKNGENIWMLSDRPKENFMRKFMGRTPGRVMEDRINTFMFPYDLINMEISKYNVKIEKTTALSTNTDGIIMGTLVNCKPISALWCSFVMSMLYNKFFSDENIDAIRAYSGGMVAIPQLAEKSTALVPEGEYGVVLAEQYGIVEQTRISVEDLKTEKIKYADGYRIHHQNDWLIEKYGDKIPEETLNLNGNSGTQNMLIDGKEISFLSFDRNIVGTKETIHQARLFIARHNFADQIERLYEEDVKKQLPSLEQWYRKKLSERKDWIEDIIRKGECILPKKLYDELLPEYKEAYERGEKVSFTSTKTFHLSFEQIRDENCLEVKEEKEDAFLRKATLLRQFDGKEKSFLTGKPISFTYKIKVNCPEAIAKVLGMEVKDLPEMLQHYTPMSGVGEGNNILNDLDPVEFINNEISAFDADIWIYISKSEVKNIKK